MKSIIHILSLGFISLCLATIIQAQTPSPSPAGGTAVAGATNSARTDVYHVYLVHAALGKTADLAESFKSPGPNAPAPGHMIVLQHQEGDSWDYAVIGHFGTKFTVEAAREQMPNAQRDLSDWHSDTIVNGPSWAEFSRALGIGDDAAKTSGSVYVVSTNRAAPGHREQLEKVLGQPADPATDKWVGSVLMQHLEGSPWHYLAIVRYASWQDFAAEKTKTVPASMKKDSGWFQFRDNLALHADTLCSRIQ